MATTQVLTVAQVGQSWKQFLIESALLRDHWRFTALQTLGATRRNPSVERFAPGLLYIKMVAVLDAALSAAIAQRGLTMSGYRRDLNGRISFLTNRGLLLDGALLHRVREARNALAHQFNPVVEWGVLDTDTGVVHAELRHLGFVGERPDLRTFVTRNVDLEPEPGVIMTHHYVFGAKQGDAVQAEYKWSIKYWHQGWDEERVKKALANGEKLPRADE